jgi:hypothetical protein
MSRAQTFRRLLFIWLGAAVFTVGPLLWLDVARRGVTTRGIVSAALLLILLAGVVVQGIR